jgi:hypothetical protein
MSLQSETLADNNDINKVDMNKIFNSNEQHCLSKNDADKTNDVIKK